MIGVALDLGGTDPPVSLSASCPRELRLQFEARHVFTT